MTWSPLKPRAENVDEMVWGGEVIKDEEHSQQLPQLPQNFPGMPWCAESPTSDFSHRGGGVTPKEPWKETSWISII